MNIYQAHAFTGSRAWEAIDIERISDATVRLHWTDQPYIWHVNEGPEVFVVLNGNVTMKFRVEGDEQEVTLAPGDIFHAEKGDSHVAHPLGQARILVIEQAGSI